jgi:hypothetical protein
MWGIVILLLLAMTTTATAAKINTEYPCIIALLHRLSNPS